ncbi:alanine racemase [Thalassospira sp.]|uniref:alanine racemase n=1 Tax=Thalassospira sp. TaxID=1912094 RepID=UPI003AA86671
MFDNLETPRLILDIERLKANAQPFIDKAAQLGLMLRPHLKTSKSLDVARIAKNGDSSGFTVSTLKEAEYFIRDGLTSILYTGAVTQNKFDRVRHIGEINNERLLLVTDSLEAAQAAVTYTQEHACHFDFLIEVDCGEHRSGLPFGSTKIIDIAATLHKGEYTHFRGVMTHAGHSYSTNDRTKLAQIAEAERSAAVDAANLLSEAGFDCEIVSIGSTPTFLRADHLDGITEVRAGIYLFWDLAQYSRGVCNLNDIAMSVLSTVIGHNRQGSSIILDAGALAMSKDIGANTFLPDARYGYVCDPVTMERIDQLSIDVVHQEHGTVNVKDDSLFERLPIGAKVRVLPNHACLTAAPYQSYTVIEDDRIIDEWVKVTGW